MKMNVNSYTKETMSCVEELQFFCYISLKTVKKKTCEYDWIHESK